MKDSEILQNLISLAFDSDPAPAEITLYQALDLLSRTVAKEERGRLSDGRCVVNATPPPEKFVDG